MKVYFIRRYIAVKEDFLVKIKFNNNLPFITLSLHLSIALGLLDASPRSHCMAVPRFLQFNELDSEHKWMISRLLDNTFRQRHQTELNYSCFKRHYRELLSFPFLFLFLLFFVLIFV